MSKHTPGPWTFEEDAKPSIDPSSGMHYISVYELGFEIIRVWGNDTTNSRHDARLIAAAPELLEALEFAATLIGKSLIDGIFTDDRVRELHDVIMAAIRKAKGE